MATLTTIDYFKVHPNYISGLDVNNGMPDDLGTSIVSGLTTAISRYEAQYLRKIMGSKLYLKYVSDMADESKKHIWDAFNALFINTESYDSAIADYIYFNYVGDNGVSFTGTGVTLGTVDAKGNRVPLALVQVPAWNRMVLKNFDIFEWMAENQTLFDPEDLGSDANWDALTETKNTLGI